MHKEIRVEYEIENLEGDIKDEINDLSKIIIETKNGDKHIYEIEKVKNIQFYEVY